MLVVLIGLSLRGGGLPNFTGAKTDIFTMAATGPFSPFRQILGDRKRRSGKLLRHVAQVLLANACIIFLGRGDNPLFLQSEMTLFI